MRSLLSLLVSQEHKTQEQTAQTFVLRSYADYCETRVLLMFPSVHETDTQVFVAVLNQWIAA